MNNQQQIIFSASPIHWPDGVECQFNQLKTVLDKAKADGYRVTKMQVIKGGYSICFQRENAAD